ncbi:MAG: fucose isomerase [Acidimicrobiales bacterium]
MTTVHAPTPASTPASTGLPPRTALLVANGDLRESANVECWPAQAALEAAATAAFESLGWTLQRAHPVDPASGHGFIGSQAHGREVFADIDPDAPIVVAEAVWQYSQQVLIGLLRHRGPILVLANWSGEWPGLVGALNLRASLTKAGVASSLVWSEDFTDGVSRARLAEWLDHGTITYDLSHVTPLDVGGLAAGARELGERLATELRRRPAIMGIFDEGCMGMYNAIVPDEALARVGVFKERLSQAALYHAMTQVPQSEADAVRAFLDRAGMRFETGVDEASELTERQILEQCRMYIAALRMADDFGCDVIGIQYQQGLKDLVAASDLAEGMLNNTDRPVVRNRHGDEILPGAPLPHFNEVDECAGLDALLTNRMWTACGQPPETTLHDIRWGDVDRSGSTDEYVWVFEISGAVPPAHLDGGYAGAVGLRQPPMYFRLGGSTIKGVSRPGEVVWSRIYVEADGLGMDIGRCRVVRLPEAEANRRSEATTSQWPIMSAVLYGISRDQLMAKHQSNHIQVAYATDAAAADRVLAAKAAMASALGIAVNLCGDDADGTPLGVALAAQDG